VTSASFVLAPSPAAVTPDLLRRLDDIQSSLGRLEREVAKVVTEVAKIQGSNNKEGGN
jgi:hypothetical protein